MDPVSVFGIATGVIGLVLLCARGCALIEDICKAHGGVQEQMGRIRVQRGVGIDPVILFSFASHWLSMWQILRGDPTHKSIKWDFDWIPTSLEQGLAHPSR